MDGVTKVSPHCFKLCTICFQSKTHCLKVTIKPRRYCVWWVSSIRRFMLAWMIAYYTDMNFKKFPSSLGVGVSQYKWKDDDECSSNENSRKGPQWRCCGIFPSFQGLSICLLMETMQKTLHGMQMGETAMECSVIRLIPRSGRRLIICIRISAKRQEILGLD